MDIDREYDNFETLNDEMRKNLNLMVSVASEQFVIEENDPM